MLDRRPPERASTDPPRPRGWLRRALAVRGALAARRVARENDSAFAFGARLFAAVALTFVLIGALGYVLVDHNLERRQIQIYAADQRADARGFEDVAGRAPTPAEAIARIDRLLDAIARRPGTLEAVLIDRRHTIVAAGGDRLLGTTYADPRIDAALEHGSSYAGREADPTKGPSQLRIRHPRRARGRTLRLRGHLRATAPTTRS